MTVPSDILSRIDELLLDPQQRHVEPRAGQVGHCRMFSVAKSIDKASRTIEFVCSTGTIDRYGEIVEPMAFAESIDTFLAAPVFPAGHSYEFSDGKTPTVGHWKSMRATKSALIGSAWFKPRGLGEECWLDYLDGNLTSVSVGFLTREWVMRELKIGGETRRVRVFTKVDLLEVSAVLIPANAQARLRAASFAGNDHQILQRLEALLEKFERSASPDRAGSEAAPAEDDAEAWLGRDGYQGDDGYFGDIPGGDEPEHRQASAGDAELKALLQETLAGN